ncbi:DUF2817 domain-containing protein [Candidatus Dojkabacteria bacterium]|uniref:DUF2817 domain-containing protein n=1 Tax=Candidatus Dojkabacteria bacterium TaxID=2099670 RepID=A0A955L7H6_9BACT|nr:DUF2817 domain-containing protein [Candidatus Dojkabacteria bacterium]
MFGYSVLTEINGQVACQQIFPDISSNNPFCEYIGYLTHQEVVSKNICFNPDRPLTRGELSKLVVESSDLSIKTEGNNFSDVSSDHTFYRYINTLHKDGIVNGYSDGTFRPDESVSRAAFLKFVHNSVRFRREYLFPETTQKQVFADVSTDNVFYEFVQNVSVATISNENGDSVAIISGYSDGNFHPNAKITRAEAAKILTNTMKYTQIETHNCEEYYCEDLYEGKISIPEAVINEVSIIGETTEGRQIVRHDFGSGCNTVLLIGAIHGDEGNTANLMHEFIVELTNEVSMIPAGTRVIVVPELNKDGIVATTRNNSRGVDLNRNFNTTDWQADTYIGNLYVPGGGGEYPASEVETRLLTSLTTDITPDVVLSYHSNAAFVVPNKISEAVDYAERYAEFSGYLYTGGEENNGFLYEITGTYENWIAEQLNIPAIVVELESKNDSEFDRNKEALWDIIQRDYY